jgi:hypothetical protein
MTEMAKGAAQGAAQAFGKDLTDKVLQTPQGQQALQFSANAVANSGAVVVGTVVAAGHAATALGTATVAATTAVAVAAAPVILTGAVIGGIIVGAFAFVDWLDS